MSDSDPVEVGSPAPDFTLTAASGAEITLSSFRGKSAILVFFMREFI
jgi:thioredoxin-dependent peroxiredoxin